MPPNSPLEVSDAFMRSLPLETEAEAHFYVKAYHKWLADNGAYGMGAMLGAHWKPCTLRCPDIVERAYIAYSMARLNYWQMPYAEAQRKHYGLPLATWQRARIKHNLPLED